MEILEYRQTQTEDSFTLDERHVDPINSMRRGHCGCLWRIQRLPAALNGLALGIVGASGLVLPMERVLSCSDCLGGNSSAAALCKVACVPFALYLTKCAVAPRTVFDEFLDPVLTPAFGAQAMVIMSLGGMLLEPVSQQGALFLLIFGWIFGSTVAAVYVLQSVRRRVEFEPTCFPATVNCALVPIVGATVGLGRVPSTVALLQGLLLSTIFVPWVLLKLIRRSRQQPYAASPAVWPICAPVALITRAWIEAGFAELHSAQILHSLIVLTLLLFCASSAATIVRHKVISASFFEPSWANFTFPTCSVAIALLDYTTWVRTQRSDQNEILLQCSIISAVLAALTVLAITILFAYSLPRWLRQASSHPQVQKQNACVVDASPSEISVVVEQAPAMSDKQEFTEERESESTA